jgi:hypothetical protein
MVWGAISGLYGLGKFLFFISVIPMILSLIFRPSYHLGPQLGDNYSG